jgi:hypothetical protein
MAWATVTSLAFTHRFNLAGTVSILPNDQSYLAVIWREALLSPCFLPDCQGSPRPRHNWDFSQCRRRDREPWQAFFTQQQALLLFWTWLISPVRPPTPPERENLETMEYTYTHIYMYTYIPSHAHSTHMYTHVDMYLYMYVYPYTHTTLEGERMQADTASTWTCQHMKGEDNRWWFSCFKNNFWPDTSDSSWNPSYIGGRVWKNHGSRPAWPNSS